MMKSRKSKLAKSMRAGGRAGRSRPGPERESWRKDPPPGPPSPQIAPESHRTAPRPQTLSPTRPEECPPRRPRRYPGGRCVDPLAPLHLCCVALLTLACDSRRAHIERGAPAASAGASAEAKAPALPRAANRPRGRAPVLGPRPARPRPRRRPAGQPGRPPRRLHPAQDRPRGQPRPQRPVDGRPRRQGLNPAHLAPGQREQPALAAQQPSPAVPRQAGRQAEGLARRNRRRTARPSSPSSR